MFCQIFVFILNGFHASFIFVHYFFAFLIKFLVSKASKMMGNCVGLPALPLDDVPIGNLPPRIHQIAAELNAGQRRVFDMILANLLALNPDALANDQNDEAQLQEQQIHQLLLMIHGEAGSGKTFLYNKIWEATKILVSKISKFEKYH